MVRNDEVTHTNADIYNLISEQRKYFIISGWSNQTNAWKEINKKTPFKIDSLHVFVSHVIVSLIDTIHQGVWMSTVTIIPTRNLR